MQFGSGANWGSALVTGFPSLGSKVYVSFDLWLYADATFKLVLYDEDNFVSNTNNPNYILIDSAADAISVSSGQCYDYDIASMLGAQAKLEFEFDLISGKTALYITVPDFGRKLTAYDIETGVKNISAFKLLVENRTVAKPLVDNLLITNNRSIFGSDCHVSAVEIDVSDNEYINACVNVINWNNDSIFRSVLVLAVYEADRLCNIKVENICVPADSITEAYARLNKGESDGNRIKAFVVSDMTSMKPISKVQHIDM